MDRTIVLNLLACWAWQIQVSSGTQAFRFQSQNDSTGNSLMQRDRMQE